MNKTEGDKDIMQGCFAGDAIAISAFYESYKNLIFAAIHDWTKQKAGGASDYDIAEIFQGALLELMRNDFDRLRSVRDIEKPEPLIYLISYQYTGHYFKNKWREESRVVPIDPVLPVMAADNSEQYQEDTLRILDVALETLNEDEQLILQLYYRDDMKYKEIASETGLSATNVGVIIARAKEKMRSFIKKKYPEFAKQL